MHIRSKRGRNVKMLKTTGFTTIFERARGLLVGQAKWGRSQKEAFEENFLWGGWQNNAPQRGREAYFQDFGFMSYGNTAKLEGSMGKSWNYNDHPRRNERFICQCC